MKDYQTAFPDRYERLKAFAHENRQNATLAEQVLWEHIRKKQLGVQFTRQHIIGDYIADFMAPDIRLIVEVDGGYHAEREQAEDDVIRTLNLNTMGFNVIRFTNEDVMYDIENVVEVLKKYINDYV